LNTYTIEGQTLNSIELKCLLVSLGVQVDSAVYKRFGDAYRLNIDPLTCNCVILSDGVIAQMTDTRFHLRYLSGILSWENLKLLRYASELGTPFTIKLQEDKAVLFHKRAFVDVVTFPPHSAFYEQRTTSGVPFAGNSVLQGLDWVAFQCLWPCEYAAAGKPCQYCFSGAAFQSLAERGKPQPNALAPADVAEIVSWAIENTSANSIQITGGSTFSGVNEAEHIRSYLSVIREKVAVEQLDEILLYITPPSDRALIDAYFALGASRIACSLEVWDTGLAKEITPGKTEFTTRERYMRILSYIATEYGPGKAFSNFIIGLEPFESLAAGARHLAERGIVPTAPVWMPMGRPVRGSMKAPGLDYYRRVIALYAELYDKYKLEPPGGRGLHVCVDRDIWRHMSDIPGGHKDRGDG
jgi:hypothetical protein